MVLMDWCVASISIKTSTILNITDFNRDLVIAFVIFQLKSAMKYEAKYNEFVNHTAADLVGIEEAPFGYDAVWTIALALDEADKMLKTMGKGVNIGLQR